MHWNGRVWWEPSGWQLSGGSRCWRFCSLRTKKSKKNCCVLCRCLLGHCRSRRRWFMHGEAATEEWATMEEEDKASKMKRRVIKRRVVSHVFSISHWNIFGWTLLWHCLCNVFSLWTQILNVYMTPPMSFTHYVSSFPISSYRHYGQNVGFNIVN